MSDQFGKIFLKLRRQKKFTLGALSEVTNVSSLYIYDAERGHLKPSRDFILDASKVLGLFSIETDQLLMAAEYTPEFEYKLFEQKILLHKLLTNYFNFEELRALCFDLEIDHENISTDTLGQFSRGIIDISERWGNLPKLIDRLIELRPYTTQIEDFSIFNLKRINNDRIDSEPLEIVTEAKLVVVGDGNVGKTSLVKRLVHDSFDLHENSTRGIAITNWYIDLPNKDNQNARINVWDFGGQGSMHATHSYFFSRKAIYLIVLNMREDDRFSRTEYWIQLVRAYGSNSPIIIVTNKVDQNSMLLNQRSLKEKYPQISDFIQTSCKTGEGIDDLKSKIAQEVCLLEDIDVRTSKSLVRVRYFLENLTNPKSLKPKETLSIDEFSEICDEKGVPREDQTKVLRRLHDLGVILYFGDDPRLELSVVLNPFWVTEGIYKIINHQPLVAASGKLKLEQVRKILSKDRYPSDKAMYILDMMRKFELCFALDEQQTQFLLPDLLTPQQPELPSFNRVNALELHFEYSVWHGATLTRLLVRLHHYLIEDYYWKNGALFQSSDQDNRALVIADEADRRLRIWIDGKHSTRRNFLNRIREELNVIHGIQRNQVVKEWVITKDGGEISYSFLVNLEANGRETCDIEAENGILTINIKEILDGVRAEVIPDSYRLKKLVVERLSLDELDDLCFKFKISLEDIEGELTRDSKARNLIRQFERTRRMPELMSVLRELRKGMTWE